MNNIVELKLPELNLIAGALHDEVSYGVKTNATSNSEQQQVHSVVTVGFAVVGAIGALYYIGKCICNGIDRQERYFYNQRHFIRSPKFAYKNGKSMA